MVDIILVGALYASGVVAVLFMCWLIILAVMYPIDLNNKIKLLEESRGEWKERAHKYYKELEDKGFRG